VFSVSIFCHPEDAFSDPGQGARGLSWGFGTLDELFETLTLLQTGKTQNVMVVLVGRDFWQRLINWQFLVENGLISTDDLRLFHYAETAQGTWDLIARHNGVSSS
jgi:predicted Rossmann-fold nucleotide-binding protein